MKVLNLWKTSVIAAKLIISEIDEDIDKLFYAGKLNTQEHFFLEAQRAKNFQCLQMLFDIRGFCE